jgi:16S rRNA processing protein RimM
MELASIGYFSKTHGVKGHLILRLEKDLDLDALKALFLESATGKAPHFISDLKESNNGLIVLLEDVTSVETARTLLGKKVFADEELLLEEEEDMNWIGFELIDKTYGSLGNIVGVSDNGQQLLLSLEFRGKEIILPMVDEFIGKVAVDEKKLYYNAPEGLIEVYLDEDAAEPDDMI